MGEPAAPDPGYGSWKTFWAIVFVSIALFFGALCIKYRPFEPADPIQTPAPNPQPVITS